MFTTGEDYSELWHKQTGEMVPLIMGVARLMGRGILALVGFAALAVFLVEGLNLVEAGQWTTEEMALVTAAGIISLIALGVASRALY